MFDFQIQTTSSLAPCDFAIFSYIIQYCIMCMELFRECIYSSWIYYIHIVLYSHWHF